MPQKYINLKIKGDVSVIRCKKPIVTPNDTTILIMGTTGSGKSSFIEALAGDSVHLGISKDQLAGYTQQIDVYELINVQRKTDTVLSKTYVIDTPGFSDSKISEVEIVRMVQKWIQGNKIDGVNGIMYICPITDTRLPGSKRRIIEMFKSLVTHEPEDNVTIVTSMWDTICNERARARAESNLKQLKDEIWTESILKSNNIAQFLNTQDSALHIIDEAMGHWTDDISYDEIKGIRSYDALVYQNLLDRIECATQQQRSLKLELALELELARSNQSEADQELVSILKAGLKEAEADLGRFSTQLVMEFGEPPPGFEVVVLPWSVLSVKAKFLQGFRSVKRRGGKLLGSNSKR